MAIKKIGKEEAKAEQLKNVEEILSSIPPSVIDAAETDNAINLDATAGNVAEQEDDFRPPAFPIIDEKEFEEVDGKLREKQSNMSVHPPEFYENIAGGFAPAIEHPTENKKTKREVKVTKPATTIDLENLDESMIMDMPEIKATSFKIIDMLDPKPKDKALRFRWANCKNFVAGNLGKYLALGFQVASIDDVDQTRTPIDPSMIDGTQIKYYDVVLLKVNVIRLMELYKTNILKSISKLVKTKEQGLAEANRQFRSDIGSTPGASAAYSHYKQALGKEPVEFFAVDQ